MITVFTKITRKQYLRCFVPVTGGGGEHHQHVVAADGKRVGGAEAPADGAGAAHHQHGRTR